MKNSNRSFRRESPRLLLTVIFLGVFLDADLAWGQVDQVREWTDSTGRFKVQAQLLEVKNEIAFLQTEDGRTLKIPVNRLSASDQQLLTSGGNPFQAVGSGDGSVMNSASSGSGWGGNVEVDWGDAKELVPTLGAPWNVPIASNELDFEPKRAGLQKKANFHEHTHPLVINSKIRRAVAGFTVSFSVPKPMTRLSLIDLGTGKAIHTEPVEANMRPLALLDDGSTVLMRGAGKNDGKYETPGQLQLWKLKGREIVRTPSWTPYPQARKQFGRVVDAVIGRAHPIESSLVLALNNSGRLVLWDVYRRKPIWYVKLNQKNFGFDLSTDRRLVAIFNDKTVLVAKAKSGEILGSMGIDAPQVGWNRIRWSPSGKRLLLSSVGDLRVINVESGTVETEIHLSDAPIATKSLAYPHEEYALLDGGLLVHLPSKIRVCAYSNAASIGVRGSTAFIAVQGQSGGVLVPAAFPHPAAAETLSKAQEDPTMFLIHPGVAVSIDVSKVPSQYQTQVKQGLQKSAEKSGYKVQASSPISLVAQITGPKTEAVSYIARGSYVVNQYDSSLVIQWNGKNLWRRSSTNVPQMLMTKNGETIKDALNRLGKSPNTAVFGSMKFPEFMQRPSEDSQAGNRHNALMSSKFTVNGLVDSK